jgi:CelD/BcsL family acetyltransferase involved in cellulose biosynthesis
MSVSEDIIWRLRPVKEWALVAEQWEGLNQRLGKSPLLGEKFVSACLKSFSDGTEQIGLCHHRGRNTIVAASIGSQTGLAQWGTLQVSQAPLGFWLSEPTLPLPALLGSLADALGVRALVLSVAKLDPELVPGNGVQDDRLRIDPYIPTARIVVDRSWDDYFASRGKNLRNNHRKAKKKASDAGLAIRLHLGQTREELVAAVSRYGSLEALSWKAEGGTAITESNDQALFYADALGALAESGQARAYTLYIGDKPAAVDLCVLAGDVLIVLKTTYSLEFKELSPASLLRELYFSRLFEEGNIRRIEFYGRVMDWHRRWTDDIRTMYHVTWFKYRFVRILRQAGRRAESATPPNTSGL